MELLGWNVIILYCMSMYPPSENTPFLIKFVIYFWRIICVGGLASLSVLSATQVVLKEDYVFVEVAGNILNSGIYIGGIVRILYFYFYDWKTKAIVMEMRSLFRHESETGMGEINIKSYERFASLFAILWSALVFFTGEFTALLPLAFIHKTGRTIPIPAWYPYDWSLPGYYEFTMFTQALTQFFMGFGYGNPAMFYVCALHLTTSQLRLLNWEFKNVLYTALLKYGVNKEKVLAFSKSFNSIDDIGAMRDDVAITKTVVRAGKDYGEVLDIIRSKEFEEVLADCLNEKIRIHQDVIKFCHLLDEFFSPLLFPWLSFSLFYIIFIAFTLVVTNNQSLFMGLIEYLFTALFEVYLLSYFAHMLTDESEQLRAALYESPWYICNRRFRSTFKFIQFRISKPVVLRAGSYFAMSLDLFIAICKTSASYFAVLRQVTEQQE